MFIILSLIPNKDVFDPRSVHNLPNFDVEQDSPLSTSLPTHLTALLSPTTFPHHPIFAHHITTGFSHPVSQLNASSPNDEPEEEPTVAPEFDSERLLRRSSSDSIRRSVSHAHVTLQETQEPIDSSSSSEGSSQGSPHPPSSPRTGSRLKFEMDKCPVRY